LLFLLGYLPKYSIKTALRVTLIEGATAVVGLLKGNSSNL